ncbi:biotin--[acetyl-CoA-carboxylase] ligase [Geopsychrobacter electrodiphilus]|uniref:biotin--[acetyl-CoA-carboxylase] ligase n=1 Tax=Geopsychrobacter electrodiphilus TaxID=225196 RepID=UPI000363F93C|nr:biotin--[acetyl-CoA-carboxylase] ligase [Geopsychrobacter electrodiphilus]
MTSREQIIQLFRQRLGDYISGREICSVLQISRAAVWKQVEQLRELGFEIEARRSRGYRLLESPDLLLSADISAELGTSLIGRKVHCTSEIASTNQLTQQLAVDGAPEGLVVLADAQTAGRGRMGRCWTSPAGVNVYCSILLRPPISPRQAPQLTFLTAVAAAETLNALYSLNARVKWPNDILVGGRKIAGLLNELSAETEQIHALVMGVGINVNMTAAQFPADLRYPATSVRIEMGAVQPRLPLVRLMLQRIDELYLEFLAQGFSPLRRRWEALFDLLDRQVEVDLGARIISGVVGGLEPDGALKLFLPDGSVERVLAGDVKPIGMQAKG